MYTFHRKINNYYNLRYILLPMKGIVNYNIEIGKIVINKPFTKDFREYSYIKEEIMIKNILSNQKKIRFKR